MSGGLPPQHPDAEPDDVVWERRRRRRRRKGLAVVVLVLAMINLPLVDQALRRWKLSTDGLDTTWSWEVPLERTGS